MGTVQAENRTSAKEASPDRETTTRGKTGTGKAGTKLKPKTPPAHPSTLTRSTATQYAITYEEIQLHNNILKTISESDTRLDIRTGCHKRKDTEKSNGGYRVYIECSGHAENLEDDMAGGAGGGYEVTYLVTNQNIKQIRREGYPHGSSSRTTTLTTDNTPAPSDTDSQARTYGDTVVVEKDAADINIVNFTNKSQMITLTVTPLPNDLTPRPASKAPYKPRDLSGQSPLFSEKFTLSPGGDKVYLGRVRPPGNYQVTIEIRNRPTKAVDWRQGTEELSIDINKSSLDFSWIPSI